MNDDPFAGLSSLEATERLARFGPNALKPHRQAVWRQFLGRFANPLVLLLLAASAASRSDDCWPSRRQSAAPNDRRSNFKRSLYSRYRCALPACRRTLRS